MLVKTKRKIGKQSDTYWDNFVNLFHVREIKERS